MEDEEIQTVVNEDGFKDLVEEGSVENVVTDKD